MRTATVLATCALLIAGSAEASPRSEAVRIVNGHRLEAGCGPLESSADAVRAARAHSRRMARRDRLYHSELNVDGWSLVGEVIGVDEHWRAIVRAMFHSPEHAAILLDCRYDLAGFGVVFADRVWLTGRLYAR